MRTLTPSQWAKVPPFIGETATRRATVCVPSDSERSASTLNEADGSVEAVLSTEAPVPMFDRERYEIIPEVLRLDGAEIPDSRQVPLLDAHNYESVQNLLGSVREIEERQQLGETRGKLVFSSTEKGSAAFSKVREGHLTDVSVGYRILKRVHVPAGKTQVVEGKSYTGPVNVITSWRMREVSIVPIGADSGAKIRSGGEESAGGAGAPARIEEPPTFDFIPDETSLGFHTFTTTIGGHVYWGLFHDMKLRDVALEFWGQRQQDLDARGELSFPAQERLREITDAIRAAHAGEGTGLSLIPLGDSGETPSDR